MHLTRRRIVLVTIAVEGVLALLFLVWSHYRSYPFSWIPSLWELALGCVSCVPILLLNWLLFGPPAQRIPLLRSCFAFREQIVRPLVSVLNHRSGLIISLCAGIGEELFFRGLVQTELGLFAASVLFSLLHFGSAVRSYLLVALIYAAIGLYFGWLAQYFNSLWVPIAAHALYDYLALAYLRLIAPQNCK
jgi:membrane protease YdiL (CAAX protease family)